MANQAIERALREAALLYERGHCGPPRFLRKKPSTPSPFIDGVEGFVRSVCAAPQRQVHLTVQLALEGALRHPFAAAPWAALVGSLGTAGRRATEARLGMKRWDGADAPWCAARTRAGAQDFIARLGGAERADEGRSRRSLILLFTAAPSGWVRQAALERLDSRDALGALPFVVARLADWVPEVRAAARKALEGYLSPLNARGLLGALPELARVRRSAHFEDEALARQIEALLRSQARTGLFLERLDEPDRDVRRAAYTFALETEGAAVVGAVIRRGIDSGDNLVLTRALAALARLGDDPAGLEEREALMLHALTHRSRLVRRQALTAWFDGGGAGPKLPEPLLERALLDPTREVRAIAQCMSGRTREDLVAFYRARAVDDDLARRADDPTSYGRSLSPAWHGLAEFGDRDALARIRAALVDPQWGGKRARIAALRTLRLVLGAQAAPELIELLHEPTLAREAARGLVALGSSVPMVTLQALALAGDPRLVRAALALARFARGRYDELCILLCAARTPSPVVATIDGRVKAWLRWTNGRLPRPDLATARDLCGLLSLAVELPAAERDELGVRLGCATR